MAKSGCIDSYPGPYHEDRKILESKLKNVVTNRPIEIVSKDAKLAQAVHPANMLIYPLR